ncbi:uncharacterized protein LOC126994797 isoform X3 [Eriocheir sinensis]|uniref:uncharacterized protein LOC126994797 isoform X3 n=1 Tax=Eriocheir sinensis TaxID=95602 RepID=UPI0021C9A4E1|nr:uncharacterized protein LOC126994797 isoform X3 [Eriocheir sinensis]
MFAFQLASTLPPVNMCPRGSKQRLGLCFSFFLCFLQFQRLPAAIMFEKMEVPSKVVTNCHLTNVPQPFGSTPSSFICAHHCLSNTACTAFCILDSSCVLVNALAVPSGSRTLQQASNGSCFAPFLPSRPTGEDLARGKSVRVNGKWDAKYADGSTVVGDMGSKEDTLMMTYEGSPQAGEELLLGGTTTLRGRYVSLYRSDYSMCLCLLQVYKA